ncbi:hypothetical protein [Roseomonas chloroacetimidivorans]|uniref:hypothetical protein n=1 Tax=Roseomonas chloroacetimidivorans TaxID=1766656 RepID=UPI003C765CFF
MMRPAPKRRRRTSLPQRSITLPRLVLLADAPNLDGLPRAGLLHPGSRLPVIFPNLPAALAALHAMETSA